MPDHGPPRWSLGSPRGPWGLPGVAPGRALFHQPLPTVRGVVPQAPALRDLDACELQAGHGRPALAHVNGENKKQIKRNQFISDHKNNIYIYVT